MPASPKLAPYRAPVEFIDGPPGADVLITCDHATNALPPEYGTLGLAEVEFRRHIAYDIGAAAMTRALAARLGATAVLSGFSRLLIDPNRGEDDPTLVMRLSDGAVVPGNGSADAGEIEHRLVRFYRPYHDAIDAWIGRALAKRRVPALLAIHSFTPAWKSVPRPWEVAVLWDRDPRIPEPLIARLRAQGGVRVGDNEPYDGALEGDGMHRHGTMRGLPHALIEVRQDLISDESGVRRWVDRLSDALAPLLRDPAIRQVRHHGSRAGARGRLSEHVRSTEMTDIDRGVMTELEAAAFRRLVEHLRSGTDVQNIELMNLAGFCRNCLSNWLKDAADAQGVAMTKDESRELVYGMPYEEWKARRQNEATPEQKAAFVARRAGH